jgi:hypothetical protein
MEQLGEVTGSNIVLRVIDGQTAPQEDGAIGRVSCSVTGTSTFSVTGTVAADTMPNKSLTIEIPAITASATAANPAVGSVIFQLLATSGEAYEGSACNFYFTPNTMEGVREGRIWGAFTCPSVVNPQAGSACVLTESFFVLENCGG